MRENRKIIDNILDAIVPKSKEKKQISAVVVDGTLIVLIVVGFQQYEHNAFT